MARPAILRAVTHHQKRESSVVVSTNCTSGSSLIAKSNNGRGCRLRLATAVPRPRTQHRKTAAATVKEL